MASGTESMDEAESLFFRYKILANLPKVSSLYKDEILPFVYHSVDKYLKHLNMVLLPTQREEILSRVLYQLGAADLLPVEELAAHTTMQAQEIITQVYNFLTKNAPLLHSMPNEMENVASPFIRVVSLKHKRRTLEDKTVCYTDLLLLVNRDEMPRKNVSFYGVFDGHNGVHAAQYLSLMTPWYFADRISNMCATPEDESCLNQLQNAALLLLREMHDVYNNRYADYKSGSTINLCIKVDDWLLFINMGDSKSAIIKKDGSLLDTTPLIHNLCVPSERQLIEAKGGEVTQSSDGIYRIFNRFCLSRAFGDAELQPYLHFEPDIIQHKLDGSEKYLVLGCDGFWEGVDSTAFALALSEMDEPDDVNDKIDQWIDDAKTKTTDNITLIVVKL